MHKSASEGELLDCTDSNDSLHQSDLCVGLSEEEQPLGGDMDPSEPKLRRSLSIGRNLFGIGGRLGKKRRGKLEVGKVGKLEVERLRGGSTSPEEPGAQPPRVKLQRRNSLKHFFSRMMRQVASVGADTARRPSTPIDRSRTHFSVSSADVRLPDPPAPLDQSRVPGVIGLRNHGNTCFVNAVLQCLSHTDVLARYFVMDLYKQDLLRRNKKNGTKGELTENLAVLLKSIWSCQYDPEISSRFKTVIDKYGSQYRGSNQHDAQEFLMWLLDKVHEDLNTASKKKYKTIKSSYGKPDEVVAAETMANHLRCNNSFVHDLFQAQFRSSLTCPNCQRQSNTFDPFLCVSIPIPQCQMCQVYVTVTYLNQQPRQVKLGLNLSMHADLKELRETLSSDTGIEESQILLTEVDGEGFHRTFSDNQPVSILQKNEAIYCIEMPKLKEPSEEDGAFILLCWVNVVVQEDVIMRFSSPYNMHVGRETSYEDLQKLMLKEMSSIVHDDVLGKAQEVSTEHSDMILLL